jgi:hypothetical protein
MRLILQLLAHQDPDSPHTLLTRTIISAIIVLASMIHAGFFGVLGIVDVYLLGVDLLDMNPRWLYAPLTLALLFGIRNSYGELLKYWRHFGHG